MSKESDKQTNYNRMVALGMMLVVLILAYMIVRPFTMAILTAAALAYIFYPLYKNIKNRLGTKNKPRETFSAILTVLIIVLIVLLPTIFITSVLTFELRDGYILIQDYLRSPNFKLPPIPVQIKGLLGGTEQIRNLIGEAATQIFSFLQGVVRRIPNLMLGIFIAVFTTYYFLKHGGDIYKFFRDLFPLPAGRYSQILARFDSLSRGMVMGQIVVGIVQGVLAWLGYWLLGVPNPVLWGFLTALISIIPLLGAALIWVPIDIYLFLRAYYVTDQYFPPIALLLYGIFVVSLIDNVLKPKIVGGSANIHPLIILFGILGGIQLFGIAGILIGPLVLTIFDLVIEIYRETL